MLSPSIFVFRPRPIGPNSTHIQAHFQPRPFLKIYKTEWVCMRNLWKFLLKESALPIDPLLLIFYLDETPLFSLPHSILLACNHWRPCMWVKRVSPSSSSSFHPLQDSFPSIWTSIHLIGKLCRLTISSSCFQMMIRGFFRLHAFFLRLILFIGFVGYGWIHLLQPLSLSIYTHLLYW